MLDTTIILIIRRRRRDEERRDRRRSVLEGMTDPRDPTARGAVQPQPGAAPVEAPLPFRAYLPDLH